MAKNEIVAGLDVGSSHIYCVIGRRDDTGTLEIIGASKLPCRGIRGGVVINLNETSLAIQKVLEQIEEQAQETVKQVYLGLRGNHIESVNAKGAINISRTDKEITAEDVSGVIENAKTIRLSNDREIICTIPQEYFLNHQGGVPDPVGMEGSHLEVDVHILTGSSSHLNNIYKSVGQAGFEILEPVYGLMAVGDVVVTQEEKDLGCLLIDLGGLTTGISVYNEGSVRFSKEIQVGSDFITRDLSHNLRTSLSTAQSIKEKYGIAMSSLLKTDTKFDYTGVDGKTIRQSSRKQLVEIIQPRLDQIFVAIDQELQNANLSDIIVPGGVVVTGGGAMLEGMIQATEQALNSLARIGLPQDIKGPEEIVSNPTYATAIGLLLTDQVSSYGWVSSRKTKGIPWWNKLRDWSEDIF